LAAGDRHRAKQALEQARAIDPLVRSFQQALTVGYQVARLAPFRRRALGELDPYASAARQVDYAVRNTRVLARSAMVLLAAERPAPQGLVAGVRVLAEAVRTLGGEVVAREPRRAAQRLALQAAVHAMAALEEDGDLAVAMVVGQVRSTVLDLLRCSGMELADAQQALDEAAGPAIEGPNPRLHASSAQIWPLLSQRTHPLPISVSRAGLPGWRRRARGRNLGCRARRGPTPGCRRGRQAHPPRSPPHSPDRP
jgi:hypothetical protein